MPDYEKMYYMLNDVVTDTVFALKRMQKLVEAEAKANPDGIEPPEPPLPADSKASE